MHRNRPILYGCGDFVNDYEGIGGREVYRPDLRLMFFVDHDPASGAATRIAVVPLVSRGLSLRKASSGDVRWIRTVLDREGAPLGTRVEHVDDAGVLRIG